MSGHGRLYSKVLYSMPHVLQCPRAISILYKSVRTHRFFETTGHDTTRSAWTFGLSNICPSKKLINVSRMADFSILRHGLHDTQAMIHTPIGLRSHGIGSPLPLCTTCPAHYTTSMMAPRKRRIVRSQTRRSTPTTMDCFLEAAHICTTT